MRRRSLTNSRPAEDIDFRTEYMLDKYYDELLPYFPLDSQGFVRVPGCDKPLSMHGTDATECHHGFGGRAGRWDRPWNLFAVSHHTHMFLERFKCDGRVIGIRRKLDSGEWDEADAYRCLGMYPLGWIQGETK